MLNEKSLGNLELVSYIRKRIGMSPEKSISFRDYMECCLYHPKYGYYNTERPKIGKSGDFYTSASIGGIMGEILARWLVRIFEEKGDFVQKGGMRVTEWGAGTGMMAKTILDALRDQFPQPYEHIRYFMVEKSPFHRQTAQKNLNAHQNRAMILNESEWWENEAPKTDVVFANELLDAFPVYRVQMRRGTFYEIYVAWDEKNNGFKEILLPLKNNEVLNYLKRQDVSFLEGQIVEVNLDAGRWIERMGKSLKRAVLLLMDYGDAAEELYAPHRMNGTLMCYWRHLAHDRPYENVGEQDMTAHVNFTECLRAGEKGGFAHRKWMTQKQFLLENGILDMLMSHDETDPFHPLVRRNRAVRQLLLSDQMSELFKVLILEKN